MRVDVNTKRVALHLVLQIAAGNNLAHVRGGFVDVHVVLAGVGHGYGQCNLRHAGTLRVDRDGGVGTCAAKHATRRRA